MSLSERRNFYGAFVEVACVDRTAVETHRPRGGQAVEGTEPYHTVTAVEACIDCHNDEVARATAPFSSSEPPAGSPMLLPPPA